MEWEKTNHGKKQKANHLYVSVLHPCNEKNIAKSMTILKLCERSFKWDLSGCPNSNRLEMALGWRQVARNLEIYYVILRGYLYINMKITWWVSKFFTTCLHPNAISKRTELGHPARSHFKDLSQSFKMVIDFAMFFSLLGCERLTNK